MRTEFRATDRMRRWPALVAALVVVLTVLAVTAVAVPGTSSAAAAAKPTVVTLTFDDSNADQLPAEQTMKTNHLVGTFYTVDGWVGLPGYLTRANLAGIAADGNEIGGHTVTHPDLIQIAPACSAGCPVSCSMCPAASSMSRYAARRNPGVMRAGVGKRPVMPPGRCRRGIRRRRSSAVISGSL